MQTQSIKKIEYFLHIFILAGVILSLMIAFAFQLLKHELPCPLCLLQRIGFLFIAIGYLLNLHCSLRTSHYSIILIASLFTGLVALRQVASHVIPGTEAYGSPLFGLHTYTWSFIVSMMIVIITSIMLGIDRQYEANEFGGWKKVTNLFFVIIALLIIGNIFTVILMCGFSPCPDNPTRYILLQ